VSYLSQGGSSVAVLTARVPLSDDDRVLDQVLKIVRWRFLELVTVRGGELSATCAVAGAALGVRGGGRLLGHIGAALEEAGLEGDGVVVGAEAHLAVAVEKGRMLSGQTHLQIDHQQQGEKGKAGGDADGHTFLELHGACLRCPHAAC